MQIKSETIPTPEGDMHNLVLIQGANTIRLALTCLDPQAARWELEQWFHDNTLDVDKIIHPDSKKKARK